MLVKRIKADWELRLSNGIAIKNIGAHSARLGFEMSTDIKITRLGPINGEPSAPEEAAEALWQKATRNVNRLDSSKGGTR